jgi:hypothetical protein
LLFETLEKAPGAYSTGTESHVSIERIPEFHPANRMWHSNSLGVEDARGAPAQQLVDGFYRDVRDRDGNPPTGPVRMIEKTPKNALRIPFFASLWPDSSFIYLYRDVRPTLASMMEAWASGRFRTYPGLPGWVGYPWSLLLVPGWQDLIGRPLPEIVAHQWAITTQTMIDDLSALPPARVRAIDYADFVAEPDKRIAALARSLDLDWDVKLGSEMPKSRYTVSSPNPEKWRRLEQIINPVLPIVSGADRRAREFCKEFG